jgi:hypothetical protein
MMLVFGGLSLPGDALLGWEPGVKTFFGFTLTISIAFLKHHLIR